MTCADAEPTSDSASDNSYSTADDSEYFNAANNFDCHKQKCKQVVYK